MKNKIKNIFYSVALFGILIPARFVGAEDGAVIQSLGDVTISNPIGPDSIEVLIEKILAIIIAIGTPIAVLFLIYSGFKFVWARGNPTEIGKARETFMWTIVGIVILLGAQVLSVIVKGTITELGVGIN